MKTRTRRTRPAVLMIERLETRFPLAGDVSVSLNADGDLVLTGDSAANNVELVGNGDGTVSLRGLDDTQIRFNGELDADAEIEITQPLRNLTVKLGGGDDVFVVSDVDLSGKSSIEAGAGDDSVTLEGAQSEGEFALGVNVNLGSGNDSLLADDQFAGKLNVLGGVGADSVTLGGAVAGASFGNVTLQLGAGDDVLAASAALGQLKVAAGAGSDQITLGSAAAAANLSNLALTLGAGNDRLLLMNATIDGGTRIEAGSGNDDVTLGDLGGALGTTFGGNAQIKLGVGGSDLLRIGGTLSGIAGDATTSTTTFLGNLGIDGSNGEDCLLLAGAAVGGNVRVQTGNGGDLIFATDLAIAGNFKLRSGNGQDTVQLGGNLAAAPGIAGTQGLFVGGATNLATENGNDLLAIEGTAVFKGVVRINLGNGLDGISITGDADFDGDLKIDGGKALDRLLLDETSVDINLPAELVLNGIVEVDADDLADAVAELNEEIEARAEACLLGHEDEGGDDNGADD